MERSIRYQLLPNDEGDTEVVESVQIEVGIPPPEYEQSTTTVTYDNGAARPPAPPSYQVATELPTYDEAERSKQEEAASNVTPGQQVETTQNNCEPVRENLPRISLGTDCIFLCMFGISFLFNWVGFFISLCLSNTVAGRCGALAGLGLSIVKWAAILQHSDWMSDYVSESDHWIWWMLMFCGFVVFFRGCIQYFQIKYEWKKVTGQVLTLRWFN